MRQKKLMLLGGIRYLLPVIEAAHEQGYYVITADYLPDNIAHRYSDEYVNVSIIDKEAVLKVAREKEIDGILSFGVDGFSSLEDALADTDKFSYPLIVKPTDSAGSKGVTRVDKEEDLKEALEYAFKHSIKGNIIVEEFIEKQGCSSDSDSFSVNGVLQFVSFSAQRFDENAAGTFVPAAYSWPSTMNMQQESELRSELQRLLTLLHMKTAVYNIETRVGVNGKTYIMEVSPRGGGNRLSEMVRYSTGVDMITAGVRAAVGDSVDGIEQKPYMGHWAEIILHSDKDGLFESLYISKSMRSYVIEEDLWVMKGDAVHFFEGANNAIGTLIMKFNSQEQLKEALEKQGEWLHISVD